MKNEVLKDVKVIEALLEECNKLATYKFKVKRTKETYANCDSKLYCLTIVGRTNVSILEKSVSPAMKMFWELGKSMGAIHHTSQHNLKFYFNNK